MFTNKVKSEKEIKLNEFNFKIYCMVCYPVTKT